MLNDYDSKPYSNTIKVDRHGENTLCFMLQGSCGYYTMKSRIIEV